MYLDNQNQIKELQSQIKASEDYIKELKRKYCGAKVTIVKHEKRIRRWKKELEQCLTTAKAN